MNNLSAHRLRLHLAALVALLLLSTTAAAQVSDSSLWSDADETFLKASAKRDIVPQSYRTVALDMAALESILANAPLETHTDLTKVFGAEEVTLDLPLPDGEFARFRVVESPIMEPALAARYPQIKTYRGQEIDNPAASVRFDRTPAGFHALIRSPAGSVYIDPYRRGD
ncbi:MAG: hypothetical protein AAF657_40015, partial [Acidobacteriota bacterium]